MVAMFLVHIKLTAQLRTVTGLNRYLRMEPHIGLEPTTCALLAEMIGLAPIFRFSTLSYIPKCAALPIVLMWHICACRKDLIPSLLAIFIGLCLLAPRH